MSDQRSQPKARPILFSTEMVRAILENRKSQTRRVIKTQQNECPYGRPGDILWVRETWTRYDIWTPGPQGFGRIIYRADGEHQGQKEAWRPSIHLPRPASRISLLITSIRAERLQEITAFDARAEGCTDPGPIALGQYFSLWDSIHGKDEWQKNPFVWVITFQRI